MTDWPGERVEYLRNLAEVEKLTGSQIAARMGLSSRSAAIGACRRYGISLARLHGSRGPVKSASERKSRVPNFAIRQPAFKSEPYNPRAVSVEPLNITFADLDDNHCRYITTESPYLYCGHPKLNGFSYCLDHARLCMPAAFGFACVSSNESAHHATPQPSI